MYANTQRQYKVSEFPMSNRNSSHRQSRSRKGFDEDSFGSPDTTNAFLSTPRSILPLGYPMPSAPVAPGNSRSFVKADRTGIKAVVKWYSSEKGFGFVATEGGADVFIHNAVVRAAGFEELAADSHIVVDVASSERGDKVVNLVSVSAPESSQASAPSLSLPRPPQARRADSYVADPVGSITGTVKWFNAEKGFGFVSPDGGGKDIFVHASALERSGVTGLQEGTRISADVVSGRSGKTEVGVLKVV